ncbi:uncharacterized protein K460DRAFT_427888, partial [Cucurbitaria berberidis CBS 394.84]
LFKVIAGLCIGLNGKPISSYGSDVKSITLLSPTIFPIIYAAILGKLLRRLGLYKAERGTTIGVLERLIGCQSIFSTLERQVGLRRVDFLGCSVLLAWLLSPLGGQASLRLLTTEPQVNTFNSTILYYSIEKYANATALFRKPGNGSASPFFAPLFMTAIQTSRHRLGNPMDLFGKVKIPDINALNTYSTEVADYDWHQVINDTDVRYTSVFGIPIAGVPETGNASFNLVTHYWNINCTSNNRGALSSPWQWEFPNTTTLGDAIKPRSPSFDLIVNEKNNSNLTTRSVVSIPCIAAPVVVESKVSCYDKSCSVRAIRNVDRGGSDLWHGITPLSIFKAIADQMPGVDVSTTQEIEFGNELIERWILDPNLDPEAFADWIDLSLLDISYFNRNLQIAINTFWDFTIGNVVRMDGLTKESAIVSERTWNTTTMLVAEYKGLRYVCHIKLAVLTMAICLVLLMAANLSMILGIVTRTPDILGFVSVSARDNPYFKGRVSSHLSGLETARALRDVRVRVGDVQSEADVGHVALATMDANPGRLSWTRLYD